AADQRLDRGIAAAAVDELHIETMIFEDPGRTRDLVRHPAQDLAAVGKLDLLALALRGSRRDDACDHRGALQQRTPRDVRVRYAGGGLVAAAHGCLQAWPQLNAKAPGHPSAR